MVNVGQAAIDVLNGVARIEHNPYVIVGTRPGAYLTDMQRPWRRIRKRAGLQKSAFTTFGIRSPRLAWRSEKACRADNVTA
ncbi:MAG: hypothetical protein ACHQRJ_03510 [Alphaproteobacteria bacterium]